LFTERDGRQKMGRKYQNEEDAKLTPKEVEYRTQKSHGEGLFGFRGFLRTLFEQRALPVSKSD